MRCPSLVFWPGEISVIQNHCVWVSGKEILIQEKKKKLETKNQRKLPLSKSPLEREKDGLKGPMAYLPGYFYAPKAARVYYIITNLSSLCLGFWHGAKTLGISHVTGLSLLFVSPSSCRT